MANLNNRRYLGNKHKLLNFIEECVKKHLLQLNSELLYEKYNFLDLFGGTGVVANHFYDKLNFNVGINDLLKCNVCVYKAFFDVNVSINEDKVNKILLEYNEFIKNIQHQNYLLNDNYYVINFSNTYLNKKNMFLVGYIRDDIDKKFINNKINEREKCILITSLLFAIDKVANTVGHYDAFRKLSDESFLNMKDIFLEQLCLKPNDVYCQNDIYNCDANLLMKELKNNHIFYDVVYIDPPYNSRQYCDAYHFLENVANNEKLEVKGAAKKIDRSHIKSDYCTVKATEKFKDLINNISNKTKLIVVSYNSTGNKLNSRSNAKISDKDLISILETKGKVFIYEIQHNNFTANNKKMVKNNIERLFVCEVGNNDNNK